MKQYRHISFFKSQLFVLGVNSIKVSIALLLMRLATLSKYKRFLWGTIGFMVCFTIACLGTLIFNCSPVAGAWDPKVKAAGHCYSKTVFKNIGLFNTVVNVVTDVMFATIPIPLIWKLQIGTRTRISLALILGLGYFACAAGIVKGVKQANYLKIKDSTFWEEIGTWGYIQMCVGIIAACVPTLKPLFKAVTGLKGSTNGGRTPRGNLSYDRPKKGKPSRNSIRLDTMQVYREFDGEKPTGNGDLESKYPHARSAKLNDSSNFNDSNTPSPDASVEHILPIAIGDRETAKEFGIRRTTEVTVQSTVNMGHSLVGQPQSQIN
ncbi:hypothetical protein DFH27DRAFT_364236 [Peziza echinospora]|nr:hypothetical protein DFH27DRAFT_364236 [Peziza echinospora]